MSAISTSQLFTTQIITTTSAAAAKKQFIDKAMPTLDKWEFVMHNRLSKTTDLKVKKIGMCYRSLIDDVRTWTACVKRTTHPNTFVMTLTDPLNRIQAMAAVSQEVDKLFVETLLSAAWNVPLDKTPNNPEDQKNVVKGAGTAMMRQIYEEARKRNLPKIALYSFQSSASFYADHLKMQKDPEKDNYFYYLVSNESLPEALAAV